MIGLGCRFFHQRALAEYHEIRPIDAFPEIVKSARSPQRRYSNETECALWVEAGISIEKMRDSICAAWEPIFGKRKGIQIPPLSVHNLVDRPEIDRAFAWVQKVAMTRGGEEETNP